jgi:hypothetical protein
MPGVGKTAQAVDATRRLEDSLHASMMTIVPCLCKTMAAARRRQELGWPRDPRERETRRPASPARLRKTPSTRK